jgi:hypothetical protein
MKKWMFIVLVASFSLSVLAGPCLAQLDRTVTNTSKKGSLLVWPLVKVGQENTLGSADTIIQVNNEYYKEVRVTCAYRLQAPCSTKVFSFALSPNQPVSWRASTGRRLNGEEVVVPDVLPGNTVAELKCWAVDELGEQQIAWNWLTGDAIIIEGTNQQWEYSAWRFAVNSSTTGAPAGDPGKILLTGDSGNYDACPTALQFNFFKQTPSTASNYPERTVNNVLTLVACQENLTQEGTSPVVFADIRVYDENQTVYTGIGTCVGCAAGISLWFSESLLSPKLQFLGPNRFVNLFTPTGSFTVHGRQDTGKCLGSTGVPLLGVMSMQFFSKTGVHVGETPTAVGPGQGYVKDGSDANTTTPIVVTWEP